MSEATTYAFSLIQVIAICLTLIGSAGLSLIGLVVYISSIKSKVEGNFTKIEEIKSDLKEHKSETEKRFALNQEKHDALMKALDDNNNADALFRQEIKAQMKSVNEVMHKLLDKIDAYDKSISNFYQANPDLKNPDFKK